MAPRPLGEARKVKEKKKRGDPGERCGCLTQAGGRFTEKEIGRRRRGKKETDKEVGRVGLRVTSKVWILISQTRRSPAIYPVVKRFCPTSPWTPPPMTQSGIFRRTAPRWPRIGYMHLSTPLKRTWFLAPAGRSMSTDQTCSSRTRMCCPAAGKQTWDSTRRATLLKSTAWIRGEQEPRSKKATSRSTRGCSAWTHTAVSFTTTNKLGKWASFTICLTKRVSYFLWPPIKHYCICSTCRWALACANKQLSF